MIGPDPHVAGTVTIKLVLVAALTAAVAPPIFTVFRLGVVMNEVPVIVTATPDAEIAGVKDEIVGADGVDVTIKAAPLFAVPFEFVTEIKPVVAPAGTLATICVALDEDTDAVTPLNLTVF